MSASPEQCRGRDASPERPVHPVTQIKLELKMPTNLKHAFKRVYMQLVAEEYAAVSQVIDTRERLKLESCLKFEEDSENELVRLQQEFRKVVEATKTACAERCASAAAECAVDLKSSIALREYYSAMLDDPFLIQSSAPEALLEPQHSNQRRTARRILQDSDDNDNNSGNKSPSGEVLLLSPAEGVVAVEVVADKPTAPRAFSTKRLLTRIRKQTDFFAAANYPDSPDAGDPTSTHEGKHLDEIMLVNFIHLVTTKHRLLCGSAEDLIKLWNNDVFFRQAYRLIYEAWQRGYDNIPRATIDMQLETLIWRAQQANVPSFRVVLLDVVRQGQCDACRLPRKISVRFFPDATAPETFKEFGAECAGMIEAVYDFVGFLRLLIAELRLGVAQNERANITGERLRDYWYLFRNCFLKIEDMREHMRARYSDK